MNDDSTPIVECASLLYRTYISKQPTSTADSTSLPSFPSEPINHSSSIHHPLEFIHPSSRPRHQKRSSASTRAGAEGAVARHDGRRRAGGERDTEDEAGCRIACYGKSCAAGLTDAIGDGARVSRGDGEGEAGGEVDEAHG
jgi:hypothetical protein